MEEEGDTTDGRNERQRTSGSNEKQKFGLRIGHKYVQIKNCGWSDCRILLIIISRLGTRHP